MFGRTGLQEKSSRGLLPKANSLLVKTELGEVGVNATYGHLRKILPNACSRLWIPRNQFQVKKKSLESDLNSSQDIRHADTTIEKEISEPLISLSSELLYFSNLSKPKILKKKLEELTESFLSNILFY
ncbi:hypothetical protein Glove_350g144 [Diversispora epigaea]|uniref:Uncharacterized protein n=1 Tax=Diversispora epigaea TaxID=1348612 RepID=A0A397HD03_9GLOM|nr:hypothetical protein Glove_350g144 [Diversispora epigaea]